MADYIEAVTEEAPKSSEMNLSLMPLRIALIGKSSSNKSAVANTILGEECFQPEAARTQANTTCKKVSPGPHGFLLLLPIRKINEQDQDSLELIKNRLRDKVADYVIVVFTGGEVLKENYTIKNYIEECDVFVKDMLKQCKGRYHVLNTNETNDTQVAELLKKIDKMAQEKSCSYFTKEMLPMKELEDQQKEAERKSQEKGNIFLWLPICLAAIAVLVVGHKLWPFTSRLSGSRI